MSKCDDDIIFEAYVARKNKAIREGFDYFEKSSSDEDSETKSFEQPKPKMTEDEAKEFFDHSDEYHQAFHNFMKSTGYKEKESEGKEMWCKCKKCSFDEDDQQVDPNQQAQAQDPNQGQQDPNQQVQGQNAEQQAQTNPEQQKQEIINSLAQATPEQIAAVYQAIFG